MRHRIDILAGAVAVLASAHAAHAQLWPPNLKSPGLTGSDIESAKQSTKGLFADDAKPGTSLAWSNPQTGNSGYATFERTLTIKTYPCRAIRYDIDLVKPARKRTLSVNWCKTPSAGWKMG